MKPHTLTKTVFSAIMGLEITKSRVAVAITKHPSNYNAIIPLDHITYCHDRKHFNLEFRNERKEIIYNELKRIVALEKICGIVVGWPLEPSGLPGSRCGQVLNLLDYLAERRHEGKCLINRASRPVTLWDERAFTHGKYYEHKYPTDIWGRCNKKMKLPSPVSTKGYIYKTSLRSDQDTSDDSAIACSILEHFLACHSHIFGMTRMINEVESYKSSGNELKQIIEQIERNGNYLSSSIL